MEIDVIKTIRRNKMMTGVLMLCFGVALILWPTSALATLAKVAGLFLMVYAVGGIVNFGVSIKDPSAVVTLVIDIIGAVLGLYLFLNPTWFIAVANKLFGIIILIHGAHSLYEALTVVRKLDTGWRSIAIFSGVIVLLGVFVIANPFAISDMIIRVIGIILILNAVFSFYHLSQLKM